MPNNESGDCGQWKAGSDVNKILYKYELKNMPKSINVFERDPQRGFEIQDPSKYRGQLGAQGCNLWANTDQVFIVNGFVNKADGNFEGPFYMKTIPGANVTIGTFPNDDHDA